MKNIVNELNKLFEAENAENILKYILKHYNEKAVFTSSLGVEDQVITNMLAGINKKANIVMLDTGRMFHEIYELLDKTESRYNIKIKIYFPDHNKVEKMVNSKGINLFYKNIENRKKCCQVRKIEPLKRALAGKEIWITGLRKEQSTTRENFKIAEWDSSNNLIKINPLLNWTIDDIWDYIHHHKVPYNPLHDHGYPSIGCQPCTRAIEPGDDIRAGRWWWENPETKECGLHKA